MSEMRYRRDAGEASVAVNSETIIEIGDLIWLDTDDTKPASNFSWTTDAATTQANFKEKFLGVAMQASRDGDTNPIRFIYDGVFEMDASSASYELGSMVAPAKSSGEKLLNQQVAASSAAAGAIGIVHKAAPSSSTRVLVRIRSQVMDGIRIGEDATS